MAQTLDYRSPTTRANQPPLWRILVRTLGVIAIGVVAYGFLVPKFDHGHAKDSAAMSDLASLRVALDQFYSDSSRYPTSAEGLDVLGRPGATGKSYIEEVRMDPWGHPYVYWPVPSNGLPFDLRSAGPDGRLGTSDDIICPQ